MNCHGTRPISIPILAIAGLFFGHFGCFVAQSGENYEILSNVTYVTHDKKSLKADVYRPRGVGPFPGVLCIHGGAWARGYKHQMALVAQQLAENGYAAVSIDHRLAPLHKFPAQIDDCRTAFRWMFEHAKQYKIDRDRLAVWGYSSGGHLAALLGVTANNKFRPKAVVVCAAPLDFVDVPPDDIGLVYWLGATRRNAPNVYRDASPLHFVSFDTPPMFIYHGSGDWLVKIGQSHAMLQRLKSVDVPAEMYTVPKAGHLQTFLDKEARAKAIRFLNLQLANTKNSTQISSKEK